MGSYLKAASISLIMAGSIFCSLVAKTSTLALQSGTFPTVARFNLDKSGVIRPVKKCLTLSGSASNIAYWTTIT